MCQVKQAIEGSGWMCWGGGVRGAAGSGWGWGAEQKRTVCYLDAEDRVRPPTGQIRPKDFDTLQFYLFFSAPGNATDLTVIVNTQWIEQ